MTGVTQNRVVVGYDGSATSRAALGWAAEYALRRKLLLEVVHAVHVWPPDVRDHSGIDLQRGRQLLDDAVASLGQDAAALPVVTHVEALPTSRLLLERCEDAAAVVVGARGHGGFPGLRVGSTGVQLATHTHCPVVVVRDAQGTGVVVGVDGSPTSAQALAFAFQQAEDTDEPLTVVHAWLPAYAGMTDLPPPDEPRRNDEEAAVLSERLAGWREEHPGVDVRPVVRCLHPVEALLEAADGARLLVVGSHGRGGFKSMLLGSVSRGVLHHATCTVAVVREGAR